MRFNLTKHHGLGNDFLVHLTTDPSLVADREVWVDRAQRWCDRRRGIGADGLLIGLVPSGGAAEAAGEGPDVVMTLINANGSVAEMSGNGIRCLAQATVMAGIQGRPARNDEHGDGQERWELVVRTDAGLRRVAYRRAPEADGTPWSASVDMGAAGPGPRPDRSIDVRPHEVPPASAEALALAPIRSATFDLGNPHLVLQVPDPDVIDLVAAGSTHEASFEAGMNVHFVAPTPGEDDAVTMRVWERGAGVTEACGTGATAVARAVHDWGLTGPRVTVHMPGGDVVVDVAGSMTLHGPATCIATIEIME